MRSYRHLIVLLFFLNILYLNAQFDRISLTKKADSIVHRAIKEGAFPGCVVLGLVGNDTLMFESYGYHTYDSVRETRKSDLYDLASVTKILGGTLALMKLYEDGYFKLDEPVGKYIKNIGKTGRLTFRSILAHQAGLHPWIPYYQQVRKKNGTYKPKTLSVRHSSAYDFALNDSLFLHQDFYRYIKRQIKRSEVSDNKIYRYSGLFFYLIPELVQNLTNNSVDNYLRVNFFDSIEAHSVGFNPSNRFELSRMVPTENDDYFRMKLLHGVVHDEGAILMRGLSTNAGLFGNATDVARIMSMLLNDGSYDGKRYLQPQTITLFTSAQYPSNGNRRGLGFDKPLLEYDESASSVAKDASHLSFGHSGFTGTLVWADPKTDIVYIFLSNRVYPSRDRRKIYQLNVRPTIHQLLYDELKRRQSVDEY